MTRDQQRARHAYASVAELADEKEKEDYKIVVNGFGAHVIRSGLAATFAFLERRKDQKAVSRFLKHLAGAGIPGLQGDRLPETVRKLESAGYMLATRELLKVVVWFRRAVQAKLGGTDA